MRTTNDPKEAFFASSLACWTSCRFQANYWERRTHSKSSSSLACSWLCGATQSKKTIAKQLKGAYYGHRRRTKTTLTQLDLFANNLPHKPYCTDEKGWLQVRKKATAIGKNTYSTTSLALCIGWFMTAITREHLTTLTKPASSSQHRCHEPSQWEQSPVLQTGRPSSAPATMQG